MEKRILVVDDDAGILNLFREILESAGFTAVLESDGVSAVNRLSCEDFDIVIMDIMMPGLNGIETLKKIKEMNKNIFVVMMTGFAGEEEIKQAQFEGSYMVLRKPFNSDTLLEKIHWIYNSKIKQDIEREQALLLENMPVSEKIINKAGEARLFLGLVNYRRIFILILLSLLLSAAVFAGLHFFSSVKTEDSAADSPKNAVSSELP